MSNSCKQWAAPTWLSSNESAVSDLLRVSMTAKVSAAFKPGRSFSFLSSSAANMTWQSRARWQCSQLTHAQRTVFANVVAAQTQRCQRAIAAKRDSKLGRIFALIGVGAHSDSSASH